MIAFLVIKMNWFFLFQTCCRGFKFERRNHKVYMTLQYKTVISETGNTAKRSNHNRL